MRNDKNNIDEIINNTFKKMGDIVNSNIIIGNTISLNDNIYVVPVSKISVGIVSGGIEFSNSKKKNNMNIGSGTGFNIIPVGFICVANSNLNYIPVNEGSDSKKLVDIIFKLYEYLYEKIDEEESNNEK